MAKKRVLLLYISEHSGHHCASTAIERALHALDPEIETFNINSFNYTNPILEKVINRTYMSVVKRTPELWDYLYDNPEVVKKTQRLREMIHQFNTGKLTALLNDFKPDAIACTQAFPCGMIADYKKSFNLDTPLIAVLTDYAPHSYWIYNNVDYYIVPSEETGRKLIDNGINTERVHPFGIPIDRKFGNTVDRNNVLKKLGIPDDVHPVLVMGGTQGLGPMKDLVRILDKAYLNVQPIFVTGTNKKLFKWLTRWSRFFKKHIIAFPYVDNIDELMTAAKIIITKPGGITTAEALSKGLPMLIVSPLPGQEAMNTRYLLDKGVAVKAEGPEDVAVLLRELLYNKDKIRSMSEKAMNISRPDSSVRIANLILDAVKR